MAGSSAAAVKQRQQDLSKQYQDHRQQTSDLQKRVIEEALPTLSQEDSWDEDASERCKSFLEDEATVFRFLRRSRFDIDAAVNLLSATLKWRVRTDLDMLSASSLHPLYTSPPGGRPPLLWLGSNFQDRYGRPCGLISLQSLERTQDRTLDECKEYIVACMEIVRRRIVELRRHFQRDGSNGPQEGGVDATTQTSEGPLQIVIAFDLLASSMSNLELELLPFLLDLLKNHFPGMVGAVFVLHYGWVHAGMWGLAKRILPAPALAKIFFPNDSELAEYFDPASIPTELDAGGGTWQMAIDESTNDVVTRLGRPNLRPGKAGGSVPSSPTGSNSPTVSRRSGPPQGQLSRGGSFESLADTYFSAAGTPRAGTSRLMTPRESQPGTPRGHLASADLEMTPSAAKKLRALSMTRGHQSETSTFTQRSAQHLKQQSQQQQQQQGETSTSIPRNRSLRDFRLIADLHNSDGDVNSDSDSDKSGKAGEVDVDVRKGTAGAALSSRRLSSLLSISRWRRPSPSSAAAVTSEEQKEYSEQLAWQQQQQQQQQQAGSSTSAQGLAPKPTPAPALRTRIDPMNPPRFLSRRSRKLSRVPGAVSPYNASNPFWGYPAWIGGNNESAIADEYEEEEEEYDESTYLHYIEGGGPVSRTRTTPRRPVQMTVQRRWRDLFRTLSYLFVLRILSLHRNIRWKIQQLLSQVQAVLVYLFRRRVRAPGPSQGTSLYLEQQARSGGGNADVTYDERTARYVQLRAAAARQRRGGGGGVGARKTRSSRPASTPSSSSSSYHVTLALVVFLVALIVRLKTPRGFVRSTARAAYDVVVVRGGRGGRAGAAAAAVH